MSVVTRVFLMLPLAACATAPADDTSSGHELTAVAAPTDFVHPDEDLYDDYTANTHRLVLCPSGSLYVVNVYGEFAGNYTLQGGAVSSSLPAQSLGFTIDGYVAADERYVDNEIESNDIVETWVATEHEHTAIAQFCTTGVFGTAGQ
ncbi:MAG TPA: hypothetical protein VH143_32645 [Kofleriaceae bacterium]|jgi:hypothetical protein|nr:hypothetical protein [Kofleriaceae bacterium]